MRRSATSRFAEFLFGLALLAAPAAAGDGIEITGQVVDESGRPLAQAKVELEPLPSFHDLGVRRLAGEDPAPMVASARTGMDGGFQIAAPEAAMWRVVVRHPRHLEMACALRPVLGPLALPTVTLSRRVERQARIVDAAGRPVAGARVAVQGWLRGTEYPPPLRWRPGFRYGTSADDGRITVASAAGETLRLAALAEDRFGDQYFYPGDELTLPLDEMIEARVVDDRGRPLAGLVGMVHRSFPIGVTGKRGELLVPLLRDQKLTLLFVDSAGFVGGVSRTLTAAEVAEPPVVLRLPPTVAVDGRVVDAVRRDPIADAWVWMGDDSRRTGHHGGFRLRVTQDGAWEELWAAAEGYLAEATDPSPRQLPGGELVVALIPSLGLAGTVTDSGGRAIAGAEIRAVPLYQRPAAGSGRSHPRHMHTVVVARSGTGGRFSLDGLRPALGYELRVVRRGYAPWRTQVPGLDPAAVPEALEITLTAGIEAAGKVLDGDGQPVPEARVALEEAPAAATALPAAGDEPRYETGAGADGRFSFSDLPPGTFVLDARAPGFAPRTVPGIEIAVASADLGTVVLEPAFKVAGWVVDGDGDGIAEATVSVSASQAPMSFSAVTAADGSFTVEDLPRFTSFMVTVWSEGYVTESRQQVAFEPDRPLEIVLEKSRILSGQVVDAAGDGVAARVQLDTLRTGGTGSGTSKGSDGDGRFSFAIDPRDTFRVRAGNDEGVGAPVEVRVPEKGEIPEVRVVLRPAASVHGRLGDPGGEPVLDARIELDPLFESQLPNTDLGLGLDLVVTDAEGRFAIPGLEGGSYRLRAEHPQYEPLEIRLELAAGGAATIDLAFDQRRDRDRSTVSGRIVGDGIDGIDGAVVRLVKDWGGQAFAETLSFGDGRFELSAAEAGTYSVMASFGDLAPRRSEPLRVGDGAVEDVVLELSAGAAVRGRLLGLETGELASVEVAAHARAYGSRKGRVSRDGSFRVSGLAAGEWSVAANHRDSGRSVSKQIHLVGAGDEVEIELRFAPGFRLRGHVSMDGAPLADGELLIRCSASPLHARAGIHDGRFSHDGVPAGRCALIAQDRRLGVRALPRRIDVAGDTEVTVEFTTAVLSGRVANRGGLEPVAGAMVMLSEKDGGTYTRTGSDGRFEVVVESGRSWELRVSITGFADFQSSITVERPGIDVEILIEPAAEPTG